MLAGCPIRPGDDDDDDDDDDVDGDPPVILSFAPADGDDDVRQDLPYVAVAMSEEIDESTLDGAIGFEGPTGGLGFTVTTDGTTIQVRPDTNVGIASLVVLTFSEPIDPDSVTDSSVRVRPLEPVDGVTYGPSDWLPGQLTSGPTTVTWIPERGSLQEYETEYVVTVDGVTDQAGNPAVSSPVTFRTLFLDEDRYYRVHSGQFHTAIHTYASGPAYANLTAPSSSNPRGDWRLSAVGDGLWMRNDGTPDNQYLAGGNLAGMAILDGDGGDPDQRWTVTRDGSRTDSEFQPHQSPGLYALTNNDLGLSYGLGVWDNGWSELVVGMEERGWLDQKWYFQRRGEVNP